MLKILLTILLILSPFVAYPKANLMLDTTRIEFNGRERSASLKVINNGDSPGVYKLSFIEKTMNEHGKLEALPEGTEGKFSSKMVRFAPRKIVVQPNQSQTIRFMLRKPKHLEAGEYRSHLWLQLMPEEEQKKETVLKDVEAQDESISIKLTPIISFSIPVIVRHGQGDVKSTITEPHLRYEDNAPILSFNLERQGEFSSYGKVVVNHVSPSGKVTEILRRKGVGVYVPLDKVKLQMMLNTPEALQLNTGYLDISYSKLKKHGGELLAKNKLQLN